MKRYRLSFLFLSSGFFFSAGPLKLQASLPTIMEVQRQHIESNGGLANLSNFKSFVANGVFTEAEDESYQVTLYKKRPNFYRIHLERDVGRLVTVFDGRVAQRRVEFPDGRIRRIEMSPEAVRAVEQVSQFDGVFFGLRDRPEHLRVVGEAQVDGVRAYEIEISDKSRSPYDRVWLRADNFQEIKLRTRIRENGGPSGLGVADEFILSDFVQVDGVWFSQRVRQTRGDEMILLIETQRIRSNVGLFDSFFRLY